MVPLLDPTNPPPVKLPNTGPSTLTLPVAKEFVIVPLFCPAKPPTRAMSPLPPVPAVRFVPVTVPPAWESAIVAPLLLKPTRPPSCTLPEPLTAPMANDCVTEPQLLAPTSPPPTEPVVTVPVAKEDAIVPGPEISQSQS